MLDFFLTLWLSQGLLWGWLLLGSLLMGGVLGSFLNVCIDRLPLQWLSAQQKQSLLADPAHSSKLKHHVATCRLTLGTPARSFCFACGHTLRWHENLPLFSYLWLQGRCGQCQQPFGKRMFWIEFSNGIAYGVIFGVFGLSSASVLLAVNTSLSLVYFGILIEQRTFSKKFLWSGRFCWVCNLAFLGIQTFFK